MKFNFKIQQYQTDAVDAVINVFDGQGFHDKTNYIRDLGNKNQTDAQMTINTPDEEFDVINDIGYKNELVELSDEQLLQNIHTLQSQNNIKLSPSLVKIWADAVLILRWKQVPVKPMYISKQCLS